MGSVQVFSSVLAYIMLMLRETIVHTTFWLGTPKERSLSEDLGVDGRITS